MFFHTHIIRRYKVTSKRRSCLFANQSSNWQFLPATNLDTSFFPRKSETPNLQKSEVWSVVCHDYLPFTKVQKLWSRVTSVKRCSRPCSNAVRHGCSGDGCDVTLVLGKKWSLGIYIYIYILCICSIYDIWYQYDIYIYIYRLWILCKYLYECLRYECMCCFLHFFRRSMNMIFIAFFPRRVEFIRINLPLHREFDIKKIRKQGQKWTTPDARFSAPMTYNHIQDDYFVCCEKSRDILLGRGHAWFFSLL